MGEMAWYEKPNAYLEAVGRVRACYDKFMPPHWQIYSEAWRLLQEARAETTLPYNNTNK